MQPPNGHHRNELMLTTLACQVAVIAYESNIARNDGRPTEVKGQTCPILRIPRRLDSRLDIHPVRPMLISYLLQLSFLLSALILQNAPNEYRRMADCRKGQAS
jgi:hypothetical protein